MQLIPIETVEAVREANPIERVVAERISLRRAGVQLVARCPFHEEGTPSFYVHPGKRVFHCHGCGESGDVFSFVSRINNLDFPASVRWLASKAGISIDAPVPEDVRRRVLAAHAEREKAEEQKRLEDARQDAIDLEHYHRVRLVTKAETWLRSYIFGETPHTVIRDGIAEAAWAILADYHGKEEQ